MKHVQVRFALLARQPFQPESSWYGLEPLQDDLHSGFVALQMLGHFYTCAVHPLTWPNSSAVLASCRAVVFAFWGTPGLANIRH